MTSIKTFLSLFPFFFFFPSPFSFLFFPHSIQSSHPFSLLSPLLFGPVLVSATSVSSFASVGQKEWNSVDFKNPAVWAIVCGWFLSISIAYNLYCMPIRIFHYFNYYGIPHNFQKKISCFECWLELYRTVKDFKKTFCI